MHQRFPNEVHRTAIKGAGKDFTNRNFRLQINRLLGGFVWGLSLQRKGHLALQGSWLGIEHKAHGFLKNS